MFQKIKFSAVFIISAIVVLFASCKKEKYITTDALIKNINGDCGYVVYVDFNAFQPRNLPDSMKVDSLPVTISYKLLDETPECFGDLPVKNIMHLQTIKRKL